MSTKRAGFGLLAALLAGSNGLAATINIVNNDGVSEGFNDPTVTAAEGGNTGTSRGQQRLIVFQTAAAIWGGKLDSSQTIKVGAQFNDLLCQTGSAVLGFAGPSTFGTLPNPAPPGYFTGTWYALAELEAVRNSNLNGSNAEIDAQFNSAVDNNCMGGGTRFWYGIDPAVPVPANRIALLPTVLHELGHGLGFLSLVCDDPAGCGANGGFGSPALGTPDIWMRFLKNASTGEFWQTMTDAERQASISGDPNLVWDGPRVNAALPTFQPSGPGLSGGRIRMHAPNPVQPGSSVSHFSAAASPNLLMEPAINSNLFDQLDLGLPLFQDIGWPLISAVNQAPSIALPASFALNEDQSTSLGGISFDDPDAQGGSLTVTLSVAAGSGTLLAGSCGGIGVSGSGSNVLVQSGTLANLNACFGSSSGDPDYSPAANANGVVTLAIAINDQGNSGSGGAQSASANASLNIAAVNDAPVNSVPASFSATEDQALALAGLAVADLDAGASPLTFSLALPPGAGSLGAASAGGVTAVGSGGATLTLTGAQANLNAFLAAAGSRPVYTPLADNTQSVSLTITSNDGGASGSGGAKADSDIRPINFLAVNDPPAISAPALLSVAQTGTTPLRGFVLSDVDAGSGNLDVVISVDQGRLLASNNDGVTVVSGSGSTNLSLFGSVGAFNTFFANGRVGFDPIGASGNRQLSVNCDDNGHTGSGSVLSCNPALTTLALGLFADGFE